MAGGRPTQDPKSALVAVLLLPYSIFIDVLKQAPSLNRDVRTSGAS
jgi:hypothetical protein